MWGGTRLQISMGSFGALIVCDCASHEFHTSMLANRFSHSFTVSVSLCTRVCAHYLTGEPQRCGAVCALCPDGGQERENQKRHQGWQCMPPAVTQCLSGTKRCLEPAHLFHTPPLPPPPSPQMLRPCVFLCLSLCARSSRTQCGSCCPMPPQMRALCCGIALFGPFPSFSFMRT